MRLWPVTQALASRAAVAVAVAVVVAVAVAVVVVAVVLVVVVVVFSWCVEEQMDLARCSRSSHACETGFQSCWQVQ